MKIQRFLVVLVTSIMVLGVASRTSRYDKFQGGTFSGSTATLTTVNGGNLRLSGNALISTDTNGNITLTPNGAGTSNFSSNVNLTTQSEIRLQDTTGGQYMGFRAPGTVTTSATLTLPNGDGSSGQIMSTNGSGVLAWGTPAGGGIKSYLTNGDFEGGIGLASTYDDGSAYVDGTGGSPSTLTIAQNSTTPLSGTYDLKITKSGADGQYEGVTLLSDTIDRSDGSTGSRKLYISFEYDTNEDAAYASGDICVKAYDIGGTAILGVVPVAGLDDSGCLLDGESKALAYVNASGSTSGAIRVSLHVSTSNASAYDVYVDDATLGPDATVPGYLASSPIAFTPVWANLTIGNGTQKAYWWRDGNNMKGHVRVIFGSTSSMSTSPQMTIPSSETIDTAIINADTTSSVGYGNILDSGTDNYPLKPQYVSTTAIKFFYLDSSSLFTGITSSAPMTWTTNDALDFFFEVPISGWKTSAALSTTEIGLSTVGTSTNGVTPTGTLTSSLSLATFGTIDDDKFNLYSSGIWTAPRDGIVDVTAYVPMAFTAETGITGIVRVINTVTSKVVLQTQFLPGSSSTIHPQATGELSVSAGDTLEVQSSVSAAAGRVYQANSRFSIRYRPDFSIFSIYGETDLIESTDVLANYTITANQWGDLTSIVLTTGEWDIYVQTLYFSNGATTTGAINAGVSTTSGNSTTGLVLGDTRMIETKGTSSTNSNSISLTKLGVVVTSPTTYYLKAFAETSITNLQIAYKISARKIK